MKPRALLGRQHLRRSTVFGALFVVISVFTGVVALSDNSLFTHIATGRMIFDGEFPRSDPYTFTAPGRDWVLQSWFMSVLYAAADRLAGGLGIRVLAGALHAVLAVLLWRLSRPGRTIIGRVVAVGPAIVVGSVVWGNRPLLVGLIGLSAVMVILLERRDPRWLVPVMWIWVNSHGSFVYAGLLVVTYVIGLRLDGADTDHAVRVIKWGAISALVACINPIGPALLWFPVEMLRHTDRLSVMQEWQAASFLVTWQRIYLLTVMLAVLCVPRLQRSRRYSLLLPTVAFSVLGFLAIRNVAVAMIPMVALVAFELRDVGSLSGSVRSRLQTMSVALVLVLGGVICTMRLAQPSYDFSTYPVLELAQLDEMGIGAREARLATSMTVGNYLELRDGPRAQVFMDDRVDMYPDQVLIDYLQLHRGLPRWSEVLDDYAIDTVLWERESAIASLLAESDGWEPVAVGDRVDDPRWVAYVRVNAG